MCKRSVAVLASLVIFQLAAHSQATAAPSPRFVDNGNGTITDNLSGLVWQQQPGEAKMQWAEAGAFAESFELAGYSDWRIPYRNELRSLVQGDRESYATWLESQGFKAIKPEDYWTATYFHYNGFDYAWLVNLLFGGARSANQLEKYLVVLVRGSPWYGGM